MTIYRTDLRQGRNDFPGMAGVYVGRCVEGSRQGRWEMAHAHTRGYYRGWVCIWAEYNAWIAGETSHGRELNRLLFHEYAHLAAGDPHGHDKTWARVLVNMGMQDEVRETVERIDVIFHLAKVEYDLAKRMRTEVVNGGAMSVVPKP